MHNLFYIVAIQLCLIWSNHHTVVEHTYVATYVQGRPLLKYERSEIPPL